MPMLPKLENLPFRKECEEMLRTPWNWMDLPGVDIFMRRGHCREEHIHKYGFAVLNEAAIKALLPLAPLLEVGAGAGYWSYELKRAGADIIATDLYTENEEVPEGGERTRESYGFGDRWLPIEELSATQAIKKYPERNLLCVWPSYQGSWSSKAVMAFKGEYLAYVGEGDGGCTGNDQMHAYLNSHYEEVSDIYIPQFYGIHDSLIIYKRLKQT